MLFGVNTIRGLRHLRRRLTPQQMEVLSSIGRLADLNVVSGSELEDSARCARWSVPGLVLQTVREQESEAGQQFHLSSPGD